jgi:hypothetical protein
MKIECVGPPFTYRWPTGEVRLVPGHPVELPEGRAARLLEKAPGRVRVVESADRIDVDPHRMCRDVGQPFVRTLAGGGARRPSAWSPGVHPLTGSECVIPTAWLRP